MRSLFLLTSKNLKLLIRAKSSALIVVFAPLLLMLIIGLSYDTSTTTINVGIHAPALTDDVNAVIALLQEKDFKVVTYDQTIDDCVQDIKSGFVHTCINLPESLKVESNTPKEVTFYLDPSRINLVWMIQDTLQSKFNFKAQQISQEISANILSLLAMSKQTVQEKSTALQTAKTQTASASGSTETVKTSLGTLDATTTTVNYDKTVLTTAATDLKLASENITKASAAVDNANISSSDKNAIKSLLDEADNSIDKALVLVDGTDTGSIRGLIESLEIDIGLAYQKLTAIAETLTSSTSSLSSAQQTLTEATATLESTITALNNLQTSLEANKITEASTIAVPIVTKIEKVGEEKTFLNYLFPTLLTIVVMFTSLLLGTTLVMMEKNSPAFMRNFFIPLRQTTFVAATYLTTIILIVIQILIILGVSLAFLQDSWSVFPLLFVILLIAASIFTFLGMMIGYAFTSEETGVLASLSLGSVFLFLSGAILPLESSSPLVRDLTAYNPFVLIEKLLREVFLFNNSFEVIWVDGVIVIGYAVVLFFAILIAESLLQKHLVHRFMKHHHKLHRQTDKQNKNDV
ncbi:TPA: ABC transporter permease [Candidatus Woesearchaeota archaeon]|nr:ABC transporter permease [Candidatus Woesearchaeota archaeon]